MYFDPQGHILAPCFEDKISIPDLLASCMAFVALVHPTLRECHQNVSLLVDCSVFVYYTSTEIL